MVAPEVSPSPTIKIDVNQALEIGHEVEPRVIEVLPAAVISFRHSFMHLERAPAAFQKVVEALRLGKEGPSFAGIPFRKFVDAANRPLPDKRRKRLCDLRKSKTFRFSPQTIKQLEELAKRDGVGQTEVLERLITRAV